MKTKEQKIEIYDEYYNIYDVARAMNKHIDKDWSVHTCLKCSGKILVVYEKELESWN